MNVVLSPETQKLLEEQMLRIGGESADKTLRQALTLMGSVEWEELNKETVAAIEEGLAQARRGEGRPWEEVREELRRKFNIK